MRKVELTYNVFLNDKLDGKKLAREVEKAVDVNVGVILDAGAYRHKVEGDKPHRLKVTVEIVEG